MKTKIINILIIMVLALTSVTSVTASAPAASGSPGSKFFQETDTQVVGEIVGATEPARYIIMLPDAPLATYTGGVSSLTATAPRVTGKKLSVETMATSAYLEYLHVEQADFIASVNARLNRTPDVLHQYQYAFNGFSMMLSPNEAAALAEMEGVRVFRVTEESPDTDTGPYVIGADKLWDGSSTPDGIGAKGEGVIVGIIDTGINFDHPSFSDAPADLYVYPTPTQYYGVCDPTNTDQYDAAYDTACNDKLIGAFTYVVDDPDETSSPEDSEGHGSHTASTVAGNTVDVFYQGVATTISGVAPHAQIISFDVCVPSDTGGCYSDATVAAVDDALATGVDVINFSISGGENPYNDPVELAFLSATEAGIFVSTSAGNEGYDTGYSSVAHRSPWVSTVAASTHSRIFALKVDVAGPGTPDPELIGMLAVPSGTPLASTITASPIKYDPANLDGCDSFSAGFFTGYVALIQRGSCNFTDKTANAVAAGATYVLVFNNVSGPPIGMPVPETSGMLSLDDGTAVKDWIDANLNPTITIHNTVSKQFNTAWEDIIAAFSSLGPNTSFDVLKPDITAPGVNILAAVADGTIPYSGTYELDLYQGTSMSSPHNAGSAALLMSLHPDWTPAEIKSAMMLTAEDGLMADRSLIPGDSLRPATPQDEGSGRVALEVTGLVGLVMDETIENYEAADPALGGDPSTLNLASLYSSQCVGSCSWTRTFTSVAGLPATYTASAPAWITVDPASFVINPGASQVVTFTADVNAFDPDEWQYATIEFITDDVHAGASTSLLTEGFDGVTFPPTSWAIYDWDGETVQWAVTDEDYFSAPQSAFHDYDCDYLQDGWMVTPQMTIPVSGTTLLSFQEMGDWTGDMWYHGIYVSIDGNDPSVDDFVELADLAAPPEDEWTTVPTYVDLSFYAGANIYVGFEYYGGCADTWWVDDVSVDNFEDGSAISDVHIPAAVLPTTSNLPDLVTYETHRNAGGATISDLVGAEITELTVDTYGFVKGDITELSLAEDPTHLEVYDDLDQVFYTLIPMDDGAARFVAEITASTAPDVDLFWGFDINDDGLPSADEMQGSSTTPYAFEYVSGTWFDPGDPDVWVLVQNWNGSGAATDDISLSIGVVPLASIDPATMTVNGPDTNPALTPFEMEVLWHGIESEDGDRLYGLFDVYNNASYDVNLGYTQVDVIRKADDVTKTVDMMTASPGDTLTYTIEITNFKTEPVDYVLDDVLPSGVTYVPGSVTGGAAYDSGTNAITWSGTVEGSVRDYVATTSAADPNCTLGFFTDGDPTDAYLDWHTTSYGFNPNASVSGDYFWYWFFSSYPAFNFYGVDYIGMEITADGYAGFDMTATSNNNQEVPNASAPNNLMAMFWDDFTVVYDLATTKGMTAVGDGSSLATMEFDDIQLNADPSKTLDMEIGYFLQPDDTPGAYEIIFAYDNITPGLFAAASGTIGVENVDGTTGTLYSYNDNALTIADGSAICFDWALVSAPPKVITFQVTVDAGFHGLVTNEALHDNNNLGTLEEVAVALTTVGNVAPVAVDDAYSMVENAILNEPAITGVLANDTDADGDPLTAVLAGGPTHGALTLNADGSFIYTPDADYFGSDTFTYMANDGIADSNVATVTITISEEEFFIYLPIIIN
jgi:uncharacterized repeat protein (TIGR01451 family)